MFGFAFENVDAVFTPSEFVTAKYRKELGLESTAIPVPIEYDDVVAEKHERIFITAINPSPEKGLYFLLERKGQVVRLATDEQIEKAMVDPPQNTRAKMRGELIKLAKMKRIPYDLDWNYIRIGYLLNLWVKCNDPFQEENEKVTRRHHMSAQLFIVSAEK